MGEVVSFGRRDEDEESRPHGEPAITFPLEGDGPIVFRDQATLDEYVCGAIKDAQQVDIDMQHISRADGSCVISLNGQGHLPCGEHEG